MADGRIEQEHHEKHVVNVMEWRTSGIRRMVRGTLAAETYSMSETSEAMDWMRAVMGELFYPRREKREIGEKWKACLVTNGKSLQMSLSYKRQRWQIVD